MKKKILFITGTRADYGKMKALMKAVDIDEDLEAFIFVCGMHLEESFGDTYVEVQKDGYKNIYVAFGLSSSQDMSINLGNTITVLSGYISKIKPDMVVVHGDRMDALAGAVVGALHNIIVCHIEGGELSGTIDESTRHAISKFAHIHFVCTEEAKRRLIQLGEEEDRIYVIGSPDIDIMLSPQLPTLRDALDRYSIPFEEYGILMYHPVTTEYEIIDRNIECVIDAIIESGRNYVVVYPNNDLGSELIVNEYKRLRDDRRFRIFPSIRFEFFITLLKNARFVIGNSSAGVREACVYGVPTIDIGTRQLGRYSTEVLRNIKHVEECRNDILDAIENVDKYRISSKSFGEGNSTNLFMEAVKGDNLWNIDIQKHFIDYDL